MRWNARWKRYVVLNSNLPLSMMKKVQNQCRLPVLAHLPEAWGLPKDMLKKLLCAPKFMYGEKTAVNIGKQKKKYHRLDFSSSKKDCEVELGCSYDQD